jgi:hypothetical protein
MNGHDREAVSPRFGGIRRGAGIIRRPVLMLFGTRNLLYGRLEEIRFRTGVAIFLAGAAVTAAAIWAVAAMTGGAQDTRAGAPEISRPTAAAAASPAAPARLAHPRASPRPARPPAARQVALTAPASATPAPSAVRTGQPRGWHPWPQPWHWSWPSPPPGPWAGQQPAGWGWRGWWGWQRPPGGPQWWWGHWNWGNWRR